MVINEKNSQINSFTKGMNSDSAYDQIENTLYVFGQNIRITKNQLLGGSVDYSSLHEGIVTPVLDGVDFTNSTHRYLGDEVNILAIKTIDNIGVLLGNPKGTKDLLIYRFIIDQEKDEMIAHKDGQYMPLIWESENVWSGDVPGKISAVLYKELDNVIKLYFATGEHPIISMRVDEESLDKIYGKTIDELINNRIMPLNRVFIKNVISGRLTTGQVQYTYRFYNKYGNSTQLAPLTNKIQVIDSSRSKEIGNAENTETAVGFMITVDTTKYRQQFDSMQVFRLQYVKPGEDAEVSLIYDDKVEDDEFILNDVGIDPLQKYTIEEFSAMQGLILIPQVIEQNQEYMFCGNVEDDTIIKGLKFDPGEHLVNLAKTEVLLSEKDGGQIPDHGDKKFTTLGTKITKSDGGQIGDNGFTVEKYLKQRGINPDIVKSNYDDMFTSSLFRSLRRGEKYNYAIIFYDKYGRRSDVMPLYKNLITEEYAIKVPDINQREPFTYSSGKLTANPIGVRINVPYLYGSYVDEGHLEDIVGCQIVRRSSSEIYLKTLLQVALARPVQQGLADITVDSSSVTEDSIKKSPFYPTGLLTVQDFTVYPSYYDSTDLRMNQATWAKTKNRKLFQAFSSEIDFRRDDVLSKLSFSDVTLNPIQYMASSYSMYTNSTRNTVRKLYDRADNSTNHATLIGESVVIDRRAVEKLTIDKKQSEHWIFNFYDDILDASSSTYKIKGVKDVKMPDWNSAYSDIIRDSDENINTAIKKYRSYTTNIDSYVYNNWISFGKYDFRPGNAVEPNQDWDSDILEAEEFLAKQANYNHWLLDDDDWKLVRNGYIGAGPSCFLLSLDNTELPATPNKNALVTLICNITHNPKLSNVQSVKTEQYYGFGNYFKLKYSENTGQLYCPDPDNEDDETKAIPMIVFDGDIYITPHEFTTQYKTYNFESVDSLQSTQITNYIPLESKVNTYFDYGMNLRNTNSENLLYEPGSIDGVTTQERPVHQYNMIYSDNDASNDVFTLITTDENETNNFKQRTYYSELKSNGEFIDNFLIFKAATFIDVDSKYGLITNLLTDKNTLYYWQDQAFGKFSVNERSLVNDLNSNTIMLGQAGILSRYDYISVKYGMRPYDICAISTDKGVFWVDINNKAVVGSSGGLAVDYGEQLGVQNIINDRITDDIPEVDYDLLNSELLCKCFGDDQMVFNLKYNMATSIYTRLYDKMIYIKNHLYSLYMNSTEAVLKRINYIKYDDNNTYKYLSPLKLAFIVNPSASVTKVYDSQQIVPIKRKVDGYEQFMNTIKFAFQTDIVDEKEYKIEAHTDREGNIIYNIPRYEESEWGYRLRGKWMKVDITNTYPDDWFTISHIITKFRQSFS